MTAIMRCSTWNVLMPISSFTMLVCHNMQVRYGLSICCTYAACDELSNRNVTVQELLEHPFLRPTEAPGGPQPGQVGLTRDQLKKLLTQVANPHTAYVSD